MFDKVQSKLTGRELCFENESVEEAKAWRTPLATKPWEVDVWVGSYEAIAAGEVSAVTPDLGEILGRPASNPEAYV